MATLISNSKQKALTTVARVQDFLGFDSNKLVAPITMAINFATGAIERYLGRNLLSQTYTNEEYDGTGNDTVVLKNFPVTTLTNFQYNNSGDPTDDWQTFGSDEYWWYEDGRIALNGGRTILARQKYRSTYVAGYLVDFANENDPTKHTLPQEIEYACIKIVSAFINRRRAEGLSDVSLGDSRVSLNALLLGDPELKAILDKYKMPAIA